MATKVKKKTKYVIELRWAIEKFSLADRWRVNSTGTYAYRPKEITTASSVYMVIEYGTKAGRDNRLERIRDKIKYFTSPPELEFYEVRP